MYYYIHIMSKRLTSVILENPFKSSDTRYLVMAIKNYKFSPENMVNWSQVFTE